VARELLLPHLPPRWNRACSLTLADSNYDAAPLYKAMDAYSDGAMHCWRRCAASSSSVPRAGTHDAARDGPAASSRAGAVVSSTRI